ncbi:DUF441 domain-containing protein [Clostridium sporogenes]|uniref:UPF0756 membrane protein EXM42_07795 n=1 Tax=Clostridium botulinum TaxID=1491 RepID=A0A6M0SXR8_CLOBO|nr:DUF441 domain-containing protein [Clostridium sporogenes]NFA60298.1 DUF441 domain-containing protein [Clostridium botulinum]NFI72894.1 DUF441 domain-containing protein [Clostridium sporogenes]NFL74111.1 DUF441 domain-containing protein [Clostridium sporogenes]NFM22935.1 DUF441 domain-containing protein [Clostridium sporogenes]NFP60307.1 DUF441 domain-containing protein [Clostridium sporogenes]
MESNIILLSILVVAIIGKANSVALASCMLLLIKLLNIEKSIFPMIEEKGVYYGLILIIAAILIPIANGEVTFVDIKNTFTSYLGIIALLLSLFTTYLSGLGLQYLTVNKHGDIMPAMILGSVLAASFLGGVPVGPLITSGILALVIKLFHNG